MPNVLFVHNGFSSRFASIARALMQRGWTGVLITAVEGNDLTGFRTVVYRVKPGAPFSQQQLFQSTEAAIARGRAAAESCRQLKTDGFEPDLIIGHPGWGEMLFLHDVFPAAPQIQIGEYYYHSRDSDLDFDPEFPVSFDDQVNARVKNLVLSASYADASRIVCPTRFQERLLPSVFRSKTRVIHEGVDTSRVRRRESPTLQLPSGITLDKSSRVVTFVNRRFEPMRGFHVFMRALPRLLSDVSDVHVLLIGADEPDVYGRRAPTGTTWKQIMVKELDGQLDLDRVHFTGRVSYDHLITLLSLSTAHVYFTYPFVLSWSLLDAMSCECLVVGSDTAPLRDVLRHRENGLLIDFFDRTGLARTLTDICRNPGRYASIGAAARATVVSEFDQRTICEPVWLSLISEVLSKKDRDIRC